MNSGIEQLAKIIWDYHHLNQTLKKADVILVLGSHDTRVAERGVELFLEGWAPYIIFSGNNGVLTERSFKKPEAEIFAEVAIKMGVPENKILIENKSTNTGENIRFVKKLIKERGLNFHSFIVVQKPYMERRTYATFMKQWPNQKFVVTSPQISFEKHFNDDYPKDYEINVMVGDLQRVIEYSKKGFQIEQTVPEEVIAAYNKLIKLGYTKHLIKKELPKIIEEVGFDFHWDIKKVWDLNIPVEEIDIKELEWHFDLPFWGKNGKSYNLKPIDVFSNPGKYKEQHDRTMATDLSYPLDIMFWKNRWLLLDGLHRLLKAKILGQEKIKVRKISQNQIPLIKK